MNGRVLIIAGSDPSGGAGLQADIKTVTALGGYAMTAISALTVQDTRGVYDVMPVPPGFVSAQIQIVLKDIGADAIKIGMIGDVDTGRAIIKGLHEAGWADASASSRMQRIPLIVDPVLVATSGDSLASDGMKEFLIEELLPLATVVTPNLPEANILTGLEVTDNNIQQQAGSFLCEMGTDYALVKGGHGIGHDIVDMLISKNQSHIFQTSRIETSSTHGTGCTLASALATGLAQGMDISEATGRAIDYVQKAIETAPGYGNGHGPLNHGHTVAGFRQGIDE